jgi:hypothetical protein
MYVVNVDAVAQKAAFGSVVTPPPALPSQPIGTGWPFSKEPETAAFGYLRERLYSEQRVAGSDLCPATCAV